MKKAVFFSIILCALTAVSCQRDPYVEHKVSLEKKADNCTSVSTSFKLLSNFGGERFTFQKCLPADYDKSGVQTERRGDTVLVKFANAENPTVAYELTLDIDSYPRYYFITIGDETYQIGLAEPE